MKNNVILVVDDELEIRALLSRFLARKGYEVFSAGTLSEGRQLVNERNPNLIFLDVNLPDGNGLKELKKWAQDFDSLNVIMMSAFDHLEAREEAIKSGALHFLSKPFNLARLEQVIQKDIFNN
ncbi:response regulator [Algoriphagus halophilus]|uniref:Response regulator receiver domain-containing protein n=1 Tax=Algoriphagus halophilus TaxID=226505 RepID=A0A1N6E4Q7_9BACT|nr:response regulator [Algoriphagus halophilus]SIN78012.1 Response regulator receiver domain-containing protein [Algoriphagus halophilus]